MRQLQITLLLLASSTLIGACDPAMSLRVNNMSDEPHYLAYRSSRTADAWWWRVGPRYDGWAIPETMGESQGVVELWSVDCRLEGTWPTRHGGTLEVGPTDSQLRVDQPTPTPDVNRRLSRVDRCGASPAKPSPDLP